MRFLFVWTVFMCFEPNVELLNASNREWEQWDHENVSQTIDDYWLSSTEEITHRQTLANLLSQWVQPDDLFLEIGCGSGLVYEQIVPDVIPNRGYVGVDISEKMLEIASNRFPEAIFIKDDLYHLSFPNETFDVTVALEVFGHIGEIVKPISEMFRTSSRLIIFTVWSSPETIVSQEVIDQFVFLHVSYSHQDVMDSIANALNGQFYSVSTQKLSGEITAYIIQK